MKKLHALSLIVLSTIFVACENENDEPAPAQEKTTVAFLSPTEGGVYNENDTLWIQVNLKSQEDLHDFSFEIKNLTNGTTDFSYSGHTHGNEINSKLPYIPIVNADSDMELWVRNKDHDGVLIVEKKVSFKVKNVSNTIKPVITINSPLSNADFHHNDMMDIKGIFSHNDLLQEVSIEVFRNNTSVMLYKPTLGAVKSHNFDTSHTINAASGHVDYDVVFTAKDFDNNITTRTLNFHIH